MRSVLGTIKHHAMSDPDKQRRMALKKAYFYFVTAAALEDGLFV